MPEVRAPRAKQIFRLASEDGLVLRCDQRWRSYHLLKVGDAYELAREIRSGLDLTNSESAH